MSMLTPNQEAQVAALGQVLPLNWTMTTAPRVLGQGWWAFQHHRAFQHPRGIVGPSKSSPGRWFATAHTGLVTTFDTLAEAFHSLDPNAGVPPPAWQSHVPPPTPTPTPTPEPEALTPKEKKPMATTKTDPETPTIASTASVLLDATKDAAAIVVATKFEQLAYAKLKTALAGRFPGALDNQLVDRIVLLLAPVAVREFARQFPDKVPMSDKVIAVCDVVIRGNIIKNMDLFVEVALPFLVDLGQLASMFASGELGGLGLLAQMPEVPEPAPEAKKTRTKAATAGSGD